MKRLQIVTILLMSAICFCGCKSWHKVVEVPVYVHDTTYKTKEVHDSTYVDRWHTIIQKGDTIFVTDEVTKIKYVTKTDTAYKVVEKPVIVSKTETVEVEKPLTWWQKLFIGVGVISLALCVSFVVLRIIKH